MWLRRTVAMLFLPTKNLKKKKITNECNLFGCIISIREKLKPKKTQNKGFKSDLVLT